MLGKLLFVQLLMLVGSAIVLIHVLLLAATIAIHAALLASYAGKTMMKRRSGCQTMSK